MQRLAHGARRAYATASRTQIVPPAAHKPFWHPLKDVAAFTTIMITSTLAGIFVEMTANQQRKEAELTRLRAQTTTLQDLLDIHRAGGKLEEEEVQRRLRTVGLDKKEVKVNMIRWNADRHTSWLEAVFGRFGSKMGVDDGTEDEEWNKLKAVLEEAERQDEQR